MAVCKLSCCLLIFSNIVNVFSLVSMELTGGADAIGRVLKEGWCKL